MAQAQDLISGTVEPVALALLAEGEMYGYEMVKAVNARSNGVLEWKEGTLYPLLHKLEGRGLVKSRWRQSPAGKQRKYYRLTAKGRRELAKQREQWQTVSEVVTTLLARPAV